MMLTSLKNSRIIYVKKILKDAGFRRETGLFVLEHESAIKELIQKFPNQIDSLFTTDIDTYASSSYSVFEVTPQVMLGMSGLKTPRNVLAVVKKRLWDIESLYKSAQSILILDHIQSPGNVGAIIRNAAAFKADAVLCIGTADPYHPDSLRGMGGHCFQVPFWIASLKEAVIFCETFSIWRLDSKGETSLYELNVHEKHAFILGSEGRGISFEVSQAFLKSKSLRIEMSEEVESLNVAVTSGIVLYQLNMLKKERVW